MEENEIILRDSLLYACQASGAPAIIKGRKKIFALPRQWVIDNIHKIAQEILNLSDEWEYRRLLEIYKELDEELLKMLIAIGLENSNEEVRETANDFLCDKRK
jgi:hypothetical protein